MKPRGGKISRTSVTSTIMRDRIELDIETRIMDRDYRADYPVGGGSAS